METYHRLYERFEHGFFANSTLGVLVQSCVGGIAAMAVIENGNGLFQMFQLGLVVMVSIGYNGCILAQQKPKTVFNVLIASVTVNTLLAAVNFTHLTVW
jgi:hypothetical protein